MQLVSFLSAGQTLYKISTRLRLLYPRCLLLQLAHPQEPSSSLDHRTLYRSDGHEHVCASFSVYAIKNNFGKWTKEDTFEDNLIADIDTVAPCKMGIDMLVNHAQMSAESIRSSF